MWNSLFLTLSYWGGQTLNINVILQALTSHHSLNQEVPQIRMHAKIQDKMGSEAPGQDPGKLGCSAGEQSLHRAQTDA